VSVKAIRFMAQEARRVLKHPHPFATDFAFRTDRQTIFIEIVTQAGSQAGDARLYDLRRRNWAIHDILAPALEDVTYSDGLAYRWYPRKQVAPSVVVDPRMAFGSPSLDDSGVPTDALYRAYLAEGQDEQRVALWYEVSVAKVREAVRFEQALAEA
jgi:uncharacterized protein (DUF433 family)